MPKFIRFAVPPTCAALLLPVSLPEKSQCHAGQFDQAQFDQLPREPYDQPHTHDADNEPIEPSTLAFSMYTNTSAQTVSTDSRAVEWIMQSPDSTFDHDQLFATNLKAAGVTLYVWRTPADPAMTGSNRKVGEG
jgi:hypothetical protein